MPTSQFLAKLIGPVLFFIGLGAIANAPVYNTMASQFLGNLGMIYFSGILTLLAGIAIVLYHNAWEWRWYLLITILGWLAILGGILRIVAPQCTAAVGEYMIGGNALPIGGVVMIVVGATLCFNGYGFSGITAAAKRKVRRTAAKRRRRR